MSGERIEPVVFDGCLGALHRPAAGGSALTVVICAPVGREARCAYRPLWRFARQLADRGLSVLRYDHPGTGDSLDLDPEADQWRRWIDGVEAACDFARVHTEGQRLALVGLRLGASLAAAAAERVGPDALMLLAPPATGRAWMREQQFAAALLGGHPAAPASLDGPLELDGLRLSAATVASLKAFDLRQVRHVPSEVFIAAPEGVERVAAALAPHAERNGFPGYLELFDEAHSNAAPSALFAAAGDWLAARAGPAAPVLAPPPPAALLAQAAWVERPVVLGRGLRGVLCLPRGRRPQRGVILGNTGGDPRAGIGGFATAACRALAETGVAALRLDFAGLGESRGASHVYETSRREDFRAAAALLEQQGCRDIALAGICSGAHHALHAAVADRRFSAVLAINPGKLVWSRGDALAASGAGAPTRRANLQALRTAAGWRRVVQGEVDVAAAVGSHLRGLSRAARGRVGAETRQIRAAVAQLAGRDARLRFVVGHQDSGHHELEAHFGWNGRWLARLRGVSVRIVPDLDHGLFFTASRDRALAELLDFVTPPAARPARAFVFAGRRPLRPSYGFRSADSAAPAAG